MKKTYRVSFEKNGVYQANNAIAETTEEATAGQIEEANRKGMPIVTIEHIEEKENEEMEERTTRTIEKIKEEITTYFENNEEEYNEVIEELDSCNGYLGDDRYYNMEDLDELYNGTEPTEILTRAFYGHDADSWELGRHEEKIYQAFNPNRDYFTYNGYGNLISTDYKDYTDKLDNYFIDELIEYAGNLYNIPEEVQALIDEIEEIEA